MNRAHAGIINVPCDPNALISAVFTANSSGGADVLELSAGCTYSLQGGYTGTDSGIPGVTGEITINGNGATVARNAAGGQFRIFWVHSTGALTLNDLIVVNGRARDGLSYGMPGGATGQHGGAIYVEGSLTVASSTLSGNAGGDGYSWVSPDPIGSGGSGGNGGAIYLASAGSSASIVNSTIGYNNRGGNGGNGTGTFGAGGGGRGGAIYVEKGTLTMVNSTVVGNSAGNGGTLPAPDPGGSTGGIYVDFPDASATITNTTIAGNTAGSPTPTGAGAGITAVFATVVKNSLIANNTPGNCGGVLTTPGTTNNMATDATCVYNAGSAIQKTPAEVNLQSLADNGGPTPTMALIHPSAAIDAGTNAICATAPVNNVDQRGVTRPIDGDGNASATCDIGAYEAPELQVGPTFVVNSTAPDNDGVCHQAEPWADCTLREAINAANGDAVASTVVLAADETYLLTAPDNADNGLPVIASLITIHGNGSTIARDAGSAVFRIFAVDSLGTLVLDEVAVTGGQAANGASSTTGQAGGHGGGVHVNGGALILVNSTVSGNSAGGGGTGFLGNGGAGGSGGGIYVTGGALTVDSSTVNGNSTGRGGDGSGGRGGTGGAGGSGAGIYVGANATAVIVNSTIVNNIASNGGTGDIGNGSGGYGGGIRNLGSLALTSVTVNGNSVGLGTPNGAGGGISTIDGAVIKNSIVASNTGGNCQGFFAAGSAPNLATDTTCLLAPSVGFLQKTPSQINLSLLGDNGGTTPTMALTPPSAAIDAGDNAACAAPPVNNLDQRGYPRTTEGDSTPGAVCDIGAFEFCLDPDNDLLCTPNDSCPDDYDPEDLDYDADALGDACDLDDDNDGYSDALEAGAPLCGNGIDDDPFDYVGFDLTVDDGCPGGPDTVGSFSEGQFKIGTGSLDQCGLTGWPSDLVSGGIPDSTNALTISDVVSFIASGPPMNLRRLDKSPGQTGFDSRWDLKPGKGVLSSWINIQDITILFGGTTGNPPMFNNTRAFGKTCPLPP